MIEDIQQQAVVLGHKLALEVADAEAIISWVDALILRLEKPPHWMLELSTAGERPIIEILSLLGQATSDVSDEFRFRSFAATARESLDEDPEHDSFIAFRLYQMAVQGEIPFPEAEPEAMSLEVDFRLALDGVYGSRESSRERLAAFLNRWCSA